MTIDYNPYSETIWKNPWPLYKRMQAEEPAYYIEALDAWALTRFEDIWSASMDKEHFTAALGTSPEALLRDKTPQPRAFLFMDPPEHNAHRSLIADRYTPKNIAEIEDAVRATTKAAIAQYLPSGELDAYALALEVALRTIADFIGLSFTEITRIRELIDVFHIRHSGQPGVTDEGREAVMQARKEILEIVERSRAQSTDGLSHIDRWLGAPDAMSDDDLFFSVFAIVITGSDTLPLTIASTLYYLALHPEQGAEVRADNALIPQTFAEAARYDQPTNILGRTLVKDWVLHGKTLKKGQVVLFLYAAANRDEAEFEHADTFDIHRKTRRSLAFGTGVHFCLGQHLARLEGKVILEELYAALPEFQVDQSSAQRIYGEFLQGFCKLTLRFHPRNGKAF
jgi:cytochrome P450